MKRTKCGIIGCGMISDTYFKAAKRFRNIEVIACSDIIMERARKKEERRLAWERRQKKQAEKAEEVAIEDSIS